MVLASIKIVVICEILAFLYDLLIIEDMRTAILVATLDFQILGGDRNSKRLNTSHLTISDYV